MGLISSSTPSLWAIYFASSISLPTYSVVPELTSWNSQGAKSGEVPRTIFPASMICASSPSALILATASRVPFSAPASPAASVSSPAASVSSASAAVVSSVSSASVSAAVVSAAVVSAAVVSSAPPEHPVIAAIIAAAVAARIKFFFFIIIHSPLFLFGRRIGCFRRPFDSRLLMLICIIVHNYTFVKRFFAFFLILFYFYA